MPSGISGSVSAASAPRYGHGWQSPAGQNPDPWRRRSGPPSGAISAAAQANARSSMDQARLPSRGGRRSIRRRRGRFWRRPPRLPHRCEKKVLGYGKYRTISRWRECSIFPLCAQIRTASCPSTLAALALPGVAGVRPLRMCPITGGTPSAGTPRSLWAGTRASAMPSVWWQPRPRRSWRKPKSWSKGAEYSNL